MITLIIIGITCLFSYQGINSIDVKSKLIYSPYMVATKGQHYRIISHAFIHSGYVHLFFNMFVLWQFGTTVENDFKVLFGSKSELYYACLYIGGIICASIPAMNRHKENPYYSALGASGAVSAVFFSYILMHPLRTLNLYFVIPIPAVILGVLYLIYEKKMDQNANDNIGHDAHYWGAIFGFIVTLAFKPSLFLLFINQITNKLSWLF